GAKTCGGCHADIYKKQDSTNHAHSLRNPGDIDELFQPLPFAFQDRASQVRLIMRKGADNQLELAADKEGEHESLPIRWAFGSGVRGITLVGLRSDGAFAESRLSWFHFERAYSLTPGATRNDPQTVLEALGRTLTPKEAQE